MEVTSLVVAWALVAQAPDPFAQPAASSPGMASSPAANVGTDSRYGGYSGATMPTSVAAPTGPAQYAVPGYATPAVPSADSNSTVIPVAGAERKPARAALPAAPSADGRYPANPSVTSQPRGMSSGAGAASSAVAPRRESEIGLRANPAPSSLPAATAPLADDHSSAGELVREAFVLPKSLNMRGTPITLLDALGRSSDRRRQATIVYGYWKLAADVAEYHFAWQHEQFLRSLGELAAQIEQGPEASHARTAVASRAAEAAAELREAELRLVATQSELAAAAGLAVSEAGPLPSDMPHVGVYNTSFERVFARRVPPARAYLLQKTLPQRYDVVSVRAQTVQATQDAFEAALDAYRNRRLPLDDVLPTVADLRGRRTQFIAAVRRYNDEIAEYALMSAPDGTSRETLCGMMIKNAYTPKLGKSVVPEDNALFAGGDFNDGSIVVPATFVDGAGATATPQPVPDAMSSEALPANAPPTREPAPTMPSVPTLAPPVNALPANAPPAQSQPTTTKRGEASTVAYWEALPSQLPQDAAASRFAEPNLFDATGAQPLTTPQAAPASFVRGTPTLAPPRERTNAPLKFKVNRMPLDEPARLPANDDAQPLSIAEPGRSPYSSAAVEATATDAKAIEAKPQEVVGVEESYDGKSIIVDEQVEPAGFYTTVAGLPPARRAQELVEQLHRQAMSAEAPGPRLSLDECLAQSIATDRREVIDAYWRAAETDAALQVWAQKLAQLEALSNAALRFRESPIGAVSMLEVRAAKLAADASRRETAADHWAARWQLADALRKPLGEAWPATATLPHAGGYQTKIDSAAPSGRSGAKLQRLAEEIQALHQVIQLRAEAVVKADESAEQALQKYDAARCYVHIPLEEFRRQTATTCELLTTVTRYNRDIAEYALLLLPSETPGTALVDVLVVNRPTTR